MPNKCPNCSRDFEIVEDKETYSIAITRASEMGGPHKTYILHERYKCKCGSHWLRPKEEVSENPNLRGRIDGRP